MTGLQRQCFRERGPGVNRLPGTRKSATAGKMQLRVICRMAKTGFHVRQYSRESFRRQQGPHKIAPPAGMRRLQRNCPLELRNSGRSIAIAQGL